LQPLSKAAAVAAAEVLVVVVEVVVASPHGNDIQRKL
jgi:hypothetical protein